MDEKREAMKQEAIKKYEDHITMLKDTFDCIPREHQEVAKEYLFSMESTLNILKKIDNIEIYNFFLTTLFVLVQGFEEISKITYMINGFYEFVEKVIPKMEEEMFNNLFEDIKDKQ